MERETGIEPATSSLGNGRSLHVAGRFAFGMNKVSHTSTPIGVGIRARNSEGHRRVWYKCISREQQPVFWEPLYKFNILATLAVPYKVFYFCLRLLGGCGHTGCCVCFEPG